MTNLLNTTHPDTQAKAHEWIKENLDEGFYEDDKFTVGDEISFMGGYNDDILYKSKIIGIDTNGHLHVIWDCYWFPINPEDDKRIIKKLN